MIIIPKSCEKMKKSKFFEYGTVRRNVNLLDLEKCRKMRQYSLSEASIKPRTLAFQSAAGRNAQVPRVAHQLCERSSFWSLVKRPPRTGLHHRAHRYSIRVRLGLEGREGSARHAQNFSNNIIFRIFLENDSEFWNKHRRPAIPTKFYENLKEKMTESR